MTSPALDSAAKPNISARWVWYAAHGGRSCTSTTADYDEDIETIELTKELVEDALRTVVAPALRLSHADQQSLVPYARIVQYGAGEIVEYAGQVPAGMAFLVTGRVRLTATPEEGSAVPVSTLEEGSILGVTTLTRQPNPADADALEEVTALEIDRQHLEEIVMGKQMVLQDLGRLIDERQDKVLQATRRERSSGEFDPHERAVLPGQLRPDTLVQ